HIMKSTALPVSASADSDIPGPRFAPTMPGNPLSFLCAASGLTLMSSRVFVPSKMLAVYVTAPAVLLLNVDALMFQTSLDGTGPTCVTAPVVSVPDARSLSAIVIASPHERDRYPCLRKRHRVATYPPSLQVRQRNGRAPTDTLAPLPSRARCEAASSRDVIA